MVEPTSAVPPAPPRQIGRMPPPSPPSRRVPIIIGAVIVIGLMGAFYLGTRSSQPRTESSPATLTGALTTTPVAPAWAADFGKDQYGTWAKLVVGGQTQMMRLIPAGSFQMGSENGEDWEKPVHQVSLSAYWLGDSEVTQSMWQAVIGNNPSDFKGDSTRPVEQVSWDDCWVFINKLNKQVPGLRAGLPTEAQWEYACRAGTTGDHAGDLDAMAWHGVNANQQTHPVKTKLANAWGLYDMHGNVWERCADYWSDSYAGGSQRDPIGPSSGPWRVFRGGSWFEGRDKQDAARVMRSANRVGRSGGWIPNFIGFRLAALATP